MLVSSSLCLLVGSCSGCSLNPNMDSGWAATYSETRPESFAICSKQLELFCCLRGVVCLPWKALLLFQGSVFLVKNQSVQTADACSFMSFCYFSADIQCLWVKSLVLFTLEKFRHRTAAAVNLIIDCVLSSGVCYLPSFPPSLSSPPHLLLLLTHSDLTFYIKMLSETRGFSVKPSSKTVSFSAFGGKRK